MLRYISFSHAASQDGGAAQELENMYCQLLSLSFVVHLATFSTVYCMEGVAHSISCDVSNKAVQH